VRNLQYTDFVCLTSKKSKEKKKTKKHRGEEEKDKKKKVRDNIRLKLVRVFTSDTEEKEIKQERNKLSYQRCTNREGRRKLVVSSFDNYRTVDT